MNIQSNRSDAYASTNINTPPLYSVAVGGRQGGSPPPSQKRMLVFRPKRLQSLAEHPSSTNATPAPAMKMTSAPTTKKSIAAALPARIGGMGTKERFPLSSLSPNTTISKEPMVKAGSIPVQHTPPNPKQRITRDGDDTADVLCNPIAPVEYDILHKLSQPDSGATTATPELVTSSINYDGPEMPSLPASDEHTVTCGMNDRDTAQPLLPSTAASTLTEEVLDGLSLYTMTGLSPSCTHYGTVQNGVAATSSLGTSIPGFKHPTASQQFSLMAGATVTVEQLLREVSCSTKPILLYPAGHNVRARADAPEDAANTTSQTHTNNEETLLWRAWTIPSTPGIMHTFYFSCQPGQSKSGQDSKDDYDDQENADGVGTTIYAINEMKTKAKSLPNTNAVITPQGVMEESSSSYQPHLVHSATQTADRYSTSETVTRISSASTRTVDTSRSQWLQLSPEIIFPIMVGCGASSNAPKTTKPDDNPTDKKEQTYSPNNNEIKSQDRSMSTIVLDETYLIDPSDGHGGICSLATGYSDDGTTEDDLREPSTTTEATSCDYSLTSDLGHACEIEGTIDTGDELYTAIGLENVASDGLLQVAADFCFSPIVITDHKIPATKNNLHDRSKPSYPMNSGHVCAVELESIYRTVELDTVTRNCRKGVRFSDDVQYIEPEQDLLELSFVQDDCLNNEQSMLSEGSDHLGGDIHQHQSGESSYASEGVETFRFINNPDNDEVLIIFEPEPYTEDSGYVSNILGDDSEISCIQQFRAKLLYTLNNNDPGLDSEGKGSTPDIAADTGCFLTGDSLYDADSEATSGNADADESNNGDEDGASHCEESFFCEDPGACYGYSGETQKEMESRWDAEVRYFFECQQKEEELVQTNYTTIGSDGVEENLDQPEEIAPSGNTASEGVEVGGCDSADGENTIIVENVDVEGVAAPPSNRGGMMEKDDCTLKEVLDICAGVAQRPTDGSGHAVGARKARKGIKRVGRKFRNVWDGVVKIGKEISTTGKKGTGEGLTNNG